MASFGFFESSQPEIPLYANALNKENFGVLIEEHKSNEMILTQKALSIQIPNFYCQSIIQIAQKFAALC